MRHAYGTCATTGRMEDIDDVFAVVSARSGLGQHPGRKGVEGWKTGARRARQHTRACAMAAGQSRANERDGTYEESGRWALKRLAMELSGKPVAAKGPSRLS